MALLDPRLQQAISTPRIQSQVGELIQLALRALDDLKRLDESLYQQFVASRDAPDATSQAAANLRRLWDDTFRGLLALMSFCRTFDTDRDAATTSSTPDAESFDFGDFEASAAPAAEPELALGAGDIGDLLEGIDEHVNEGDAERWSKVLEKVLSIEYGLRSQYTDMRSRMAVALEAGQVSQVLGILDDMQSSASEGVHALVTGVYEAFVPDANPATIVPGYLTALGRALLVRRGLAELAATVGQHNDALQDQDTARHEQALALLRDTLKAFVGSVVCRAMRAADRWQMVEFERALASQPLAAARLTSEGLAKYLESLGSINQREVLVLHDQRTLEQMREALSNARQLLDLSPRTANDMLEQAYQAAQRLRGRHPATDVLVIQLERYAPTSSNPADRVTFLERLEALLAAAGG